MSDYGEYFKEEEFLCHCGVCEFPGIDQLLLDKLNLAREAAHIVFHITSGYRCKKFNKEIGGSRNSSHMKGMAADIYCVDSSRRFRILDACLPYFNRIGVDKQFIHVDVDYDKPGEVMWVY